MKARIKGNPRGKPVIKRKPHRLLFEGNQASATRPPSCENENKIEATLTNFLCNEEIIIRNNENI